MNIRTISLFDIQVSHNPRRPTPELQDNLGHEGDLVGLDWSKYPITPLAFAQQYGLSFDPSKREYFTSLIEKYESGPKGLVELATSRRGQAIQPINVRSYRIKGEGNYLERFGVIAGERRTLAAIYNYAKHGDAPKIDAVARTCSVADAYDLAIAENAQRKDATDLEYGRIFQGYRQQINPATEKNFTLKEISAKLGMDYQYVRGREALTHLSESDQNRVERGTLGVTAAIEKGLKIKQGKENQPLPDKKEGRQRALNLTQIQELFDKKFQDDNNPLDIKYAILGVLATVMQVDYDVAEKESRNRIAKKD